MGRRNIRFNKFSPNEFRFRQNTSINQKMLEGRNRETKIMEELAERGTLVLPFGKYKKKNLEQVFKIDPGYLVWLSESSFWAKTGLRKFLEMKKTIN